MLWLNKLIYNKKNICVLSLTAVSENASQFSPHSSQNNGLKVNRQVGYDTCYFSQHTRRNGERKRAGLFSCKLNSKSCEACIAKCGNTSSATINAAFRQREDWEATVYYWPFFTSSLSNSFSPSRQGRRVIKYWQKEENKRIDTFNI